MTGNTDAEISTVPETLGTATTSTNYLGTRGTADNLVIATGNKTHAILTSDGTLSGGGELTSSLSWGSANTFTNTTSNNIALGKGNSVGAVNVNLQGLQSGLIMF